MFRSIAFCLMALVMLMALGRSLGQTTTKQALRPLELTQQRKGSCIMPEMPASITYERVDQSGKVKHSTTPCGEGEACGISLNTYANGSQICIAGFRNHDSCQGNDCKPGWRHRCVDGWWKKAESCLPGELKKAKLQFEQAGNSGISPEPSKDTFADQINTFKPELEAQQKADNANMSCGNTAPGFDKYESRFRNALRSGGESDAQIDASLAQARKLSPLGERPSIDQLISKVGSIDKLIELTRLQIIDYQKNLNATDCTASPQHAAACELDRLGIESNKEWLNWLLCHKRARS